MKRFFLMMAMLVSLATTNAANAQLNNVFANPGTQTQQQQQPGQTGSTDLNQVLQATGLTYQNEGESAYLVTSEHEGVKLPVYVYLNKAKSLV